MITFIDTLAPNPYTVDMGLIHNFDQLALTESRKKVLEMVEAALTAIQPQQVLQKNITLEENVLTIHGKSFSLDTYERVFLVGFGKGSSGVAKYLENLLGERLTEGYVIDVVNEAFAKIHYTQGTHPLPSQTNIDFTKGVLEKVTDLTEKDLVLVVICGGGSALFESSTVTLDTITHINDVLLKSGATISEMNIVRKHVSKVKGGKFAKHLYPATIVSLLFSDVPGNDLSVIASGPTVADTTTQEDLIAVLEKYSITHEIALSENDFSPTVHEEKYFEHVSNILVISNMTAIDAMSAKATELGLLPRIYTDRLQGDAKKLGEQLIDATKPGEVLLAGGESTIRVTGTGKGGRNQALVVSALPYVGHNTVIVAFDSDGMDFFGFAGALGDAKSLEKAELMHINREQYVSQDDSYTFLEKIGDGIDTGKLESNVSDLYIVYKE